MISVVESFERGDVDVRAFDHRAHVRVAWHMLETFDLLEALSRFCAGLQRLVAAHGAHAKYNATVSVAFMLLIRERMREGETWSEFAAREVAFIARGMEAVRERYDEQRLFAPEARLRFELPQPRRPL